MTYELELERVVKEIKENKAKKVCVQLPNGLKSKATEIVTYLEEKTNANVFIWLGSCFGACDYPVELKDKVDLLIQWGHSK